MSWLPLTEIADWLLTFAIHSTIILAFAWLLSAALGKRWLVGQERILRFSLWAAIASSTAQFLFATTPLSLSMEPAPYAIASDLPGLLAVDAVNGGAELPAAAAAAATWSMAAWLIGVAALLSLLGGLWLLRAHVRLRRVLRSREPETDGRTLAVAAEVARSLGMRQSPHVSCSSEILTPIAFGCLRPEICLPLKARMLDAEELRAMLAHEVAHLRRLDPIWMWLAAGLNALFPWQVLFVAVRRRWNHLVELRCDAIAARQTSPTAVARCLLDVAEWLKPPAVEHATALGMAARPSTLRLRVEAALHGEGAGSLRRGWSLCFGSVSLSALTFAAPGVHSSERPDGEPFAAFGTEAPLIVGVDAGPDAASATSPLRATLGLLQQEHAELEQQLAVLRARVATHKRARQLEPLVAQVAQRLLAVEQACQRIQTLVARRESQTTPLKSR